MKLNMKMGIGLIVLIVLGCFLINSRTESAQEKKVAGIQYPEIQYIREDQDPSITIETENLLVKVIDNSGLSLTENVNITSRLGKYGMHSPIPFSHHLGYHGIRTFYDKTEKRNLVVPLGSWMSLQGVRLEGIQNDPVDNRANAGVVRGWPVRLEPKGDGAIIILDPMPRTQFRYSIEFQPGGVDAIDFHIRFVFKRKPDKGPSRFRMSWPCYMNVYDDVRLFYPSGKNEKDWEWKSLGEKPDIIIGDPVGYKHEQQGFRAKNQVLPLGYGNIGKNAFILMFSDPKVTFFVVNAGGHLSTSPVQNPAWDFEWRVEDYPLNEPIGFSGRIIYAPFESQEKILKRYDEWMKR